MGSTKRCAAWDRFVDPISRLPPRCLAAAVEGLGSHTTVRFARAD